MRNMYNLYQIDSFTKEKLKGNPAGVITNANWLARTSTKKHLNLTRQIHSILQKQYLT